MTERSRTKDELIILRLYELAQEAGDMDAEFDRYEVGKSIGMAQRGVDTICNLLAQANFIKKVDNKMVRLTSQGERLALLLLSGK